MTDDYGFDTLAPIQASSVETEEQASLFPMAREEVRTKSFLRWAGGKGKLLDAILPHIPASFENYYEPFLGSGAVFFAVRGRARQTAYLSDLNDELVNIWTVVRDKPKEFLAELAKYKGHDTQEHYYVIRSERPLSAISKAARFFYLNQTAWNGLWRVNKFGVFNVPWGDRPFRGVDSDYLKRVSALLSPVGIQYADFREALANAKAGDFVYLDPPYLPVSDTSKFAGYTEKRFRRADLAELADICKGLSDRGVSWVMSNRDTADVRELFSHGHIVRFTTWRSVAAQNRRNVEPSASPEVVVVGGPR